MGGRKKAAKRSRPKLQFFDGEKRPPFGITTKQQSHNDQVAALTNRIAELEEVIAGYSRGDSLADLSPWHRSRLTMLTETRLFGSCDLETAHELFHEALRKALVATIPYSKLYAEFTPPDSDDPWAHKRRRF